MGGAGRAAIVVVLVGLVLSTRSAHASDPGVSCDAEVAELREALGKEAHWADTWNTVWRLTFTTTAVGTAAVGFWDPIHSWQAGLYVSAGKSTVGALARWIMPLRIHVPPPTNDACADLQALHDEIKRIAKKEKSLFIMGHIGGIVLNGLGGYIVYKYSSAGQAALSVGVGYPIGLISNYTMPRRSWHRWRDHTWDVPPPAPMPSLSIVPMRGGAFVGLSGAF
ncbi:MAG TPA: hypothetical protein VLB44_05815 [Kofleriaceae bacterium]|nr:hypothetical protein [Kofleriaceae bacterium]